jgi:virulence factor Mce-like protein
VTGRRRVGASFATNPTLVGAITTLIAALAVFLAYNANNGLPFVSTYRISAVVPSAQGLAPNNDVRIGGVQVGTVESIDPVENSNGAVHAKVNMKLEGDINPLPVDSTIVVRAKSALGLKYLEINKGTSSKGYAPGSTLPLSAAHPQAVDIDQVLSTFNEPTRMAIRRNLTEFGTALAGRGVDLNETLGDLPSTLRRLDSVATALNLPETDLAGFFPALEQTASEVAPVAQTQAHMFVVLDTTFAALASVARPFIQETISKSPPTEDTTIRTLPVIRPFLADSADLFHELQPGVHTLRSTAPILVRALTEGIPALNASPQLNAQLPPTAEALQAFGANTGVTSGLSRLIETNDLLAPTLRFFTPAQTVCNYPTLLFRNAASAASQGDGLASWQRFIVFQSQKGPNNEGSPSSKPANGGAGTDPGNFLHDNIYPNTAAPGQSPRECEAGNEPYVIGKKIIGNAPGDQGTATAKVGDNP